MLFFWIFYYESGRNSLERFVLFLFLFSLFLNISHLILARREAIMVFFNFVNFFAIFLKFPITGLVGTHQNDFFFFLFFGLHQLILAWKEAIMVFSNFLNFLCIFFWIFYCGSGRNSSERFFFIFSLSRPFPTYFGLKSSQNAGF